MNTAPVTEHGKLLRDKFSSLGVQHACWLVLGSLMALPVCAEEPILTERRAKPHNAPTRGDGPRTTNTVFNATAPIPAAARTLNGPPIIVNPPRGNPIIGNPGNNASGNNTAPPPPPSPPQLAQPSSPPAPPSTNPGNPPPGNSANATAANRSANIPEPPPKPVTSGPKPVARGSGPSDTPASSNVSNATQLTSLASPITTPPGGLSEVLPSAQQLSDSMRKMPTAAIPDLGKRTEQAEVINQNTQCVDVSLRPDPARQSVSLVDFSGDGLIVSAVPNKHVQSVFAQAGYAQMDVSQAGSWCIPQAAARALLLPAQGATTQVASLLVQTGNGLQLMSQDQWLAHQAAIKPLAAKTLTAQPHRADKAVKKLTSKRKSMANVAKSTSSLPPT
jgi:hypothetical protein